MPRARSKGVTVLVGTSKGGFIFRSDAKRKKWTMDGPHFEGLNVHDFVLDSRNGETLYAATYSAWWGSDIQRSHNGGKKWLRTKDGLRYAADSGLSVKNVWSIRPGTSSQPGVIFAGVDPAGLFRSDDRGETWSEVQALNRHESRCRWTPGAAGNILHSIIIDPADPNSMYIAISAAGVFHTADGGQSWQPRNQGTRADFLPDKNPDIGQCVHRVVLAADGRRLYQQNHCGIYRSDSGGENWKDISRGAPSRFGFCIAAHPHDVNTAWVLPMTSPAFRVCPNGELAVYRTRSGGGRWEREIRGLPTRAYATVLRGAMSSDSADSAGVYFGTSGGQMFYTRNEGKEWQPFAENLPSVYSVQAFGPE
jgi:photosystem II stability/assembly factor-like uncharacterized protein